MAGPSPSAPSSASPRPSARCSSRWAGVAEGYTRVKVKVRPGWDRAPPSRRAGRGTRRCALWADANGDYGEDDLPGLCSLDEFGLGLIEQPLRPTS